MTGEGDPEGGADLLLGQAQKRMKELYHGFKPRRVNTIQTRRATNQSYCGAGRACGFPCASAVGRDGDRLPRLDFLLEALDSSRHMLEGIAAEQKLRRRIVGFDQV